MRRLIVRSLAESEIEQAHLWYVERSPDTARRFLDEIGTILDRILENSDAVQAWPDLGVLRP